MILRSALSFASRRGERARLSVLIFHRVLRERDPLLSDEPTAEEFDALLAHVASRYSVLSLSNAVDQLYEGTLPPRSLAITFDDGYRDNAEVAAPLLRARGLPATIFVCTGTLDGGCMWNDAIIEAMRSAPAGELDLGELSLGRHAIGTLDERRAALERVIDQVKQRVPHERMEAARRVADIAGAGLPANLMMSRDSLKDLEALGLSIGAHTVNHPILASLEDDAACVEIEASKRDLEGATNREIELFAYPNGCPVRDYHARHARMVRAAGFKAAFSTAWGAASRASDRFQLPRFTPWSRSPLKFDLLMLRNLRRGMEQQAG